MYTAIGHVSLIQEKNEYTISYHANIEIKPGDDFSLQFNAGEFQFKPLRDTTVPNELSEQTIRAIAKSPQWLHYDLIRQFQTLEYTQDYTDLLLNADKKMTDELAFCIAHSPLGDIPPADILLDNVQWLYYIDSYIDYADIIDIQDENGNYYSTITYQILDGSELKTTILPSYIYYWGVVHPRISGENVEPIYQTFWREFLLFHNDREYPLLEELIQDISVLWDNKAYDQPSQRIWTECITNHPTAIEAMSYWIGKTVPYLAIGDRPIQPNYIAHQHNGYCGELQTLAIAAQRALLIPSRGVNNIGEDHVWREFYHEGWHQSDNWWADGGGCIDRPWVYTDGWGKDMSAVFTEYGDGTIEDVTNRYLHSDESITVNFSVYDAFLKPYDNARITVLVEGLKDITWYQYQVLLFLEELWKPYKQRFNETIIEIIYQRIRDWISGLPEVIDSALITTWNYTDINGKCSLTLGKNDEYIFLVQSPSTTLLWPLSKQTAIRRLSTHESKEYQILLSDFSRKPIIQTSKESKGSYSATVTYQATWNTIHQHIKNRNIGIKKTVNDLQIFFMDEQNYQRYQQGKSFKFFELRSLAYGTTSVDFTQDLYVVIPNPTLHTSVIVDLDLDITGVFDGINVGIDQPRTTLFSHPTFSIGDVIELSGSANQPSQLIINEKTIQISRGQWMYAWNTTGMMGGPYEIKIQSGPISDQKIIDLIDETPPTISIIEPRLNQLYHLSDNMICKGLIQDNSLISSISFSFDWIEQKTEILETNQWNTSLNLTGLSQGTHRLGIAVSDIHGNTKEDYITFFILDSDSPQPPQIVDHNYELKKRGDWTQVTIYANCTTSPFFPLEQMSVIYLINNTIREKPLLLYGSHPILDRHSEDPYVNQTNTPIFGCFLGDFHTGETIAYWIEAVDVLGQSNTTSAFTIDL